MESYRISGTSKDRERVENDYYATPTEATKELLYNLDLSDCDSFYEPACGEGHISEELILWFKAPVKSTDLIYRGYGSGGVDFLEIGETEKYDCVITNPPFKLAKEFIQKSLSISNKYVIMFAKLHLLEGIGRKDLFEKYPPKYVYVFRNRINPLRNGSPADENGKKWATTICFAWFVWEVGFKGDPSIRWLQTNSSNSNNTKVEE